MRRRCGTTACRAGTATFGDQRVGRRRARGQLGARRSAAIKPVEGVKERAAARQVVRREGAGQTGLERCERHGRFGRSAGRPRARVAAASLPRRRRGRRASGPAGATPGPPAAAPRRPRTASRAGAAAGGPRSLRRGSRRTASTPTSGRAAASRRQRRRRHGRDLVTERAERREDPGRRRGQRPVEPEARPPPAAHRRGAPPRLGTKRPGRLRVRNAQRRGGGRRRRSVQEGPDPPERGGGREPETDGPGDEERSRLPAHGAASAVGKSRRSAQTPTFQTQPAATHAARPSPAGSRPAPAFPRRRPPRRTGASAAARRRRGDDGRAPSGRRRPDAGAAPPSLPVTAGTGRVREVPDPLARALELRQPPDPSRAVHERHAAGRLPDSRTSLVARASVASLRLRHASTSRTVTRMKPQGKAAPRILRARRSPPRPRRQRAAAPRRSRRRPRRAAPRRSARATTGRSSPTRGARPVPRRSPTPCWSRRRRRAARCGTPAPGARRDRASGSGRRE